MKLIIDEPSIVQNPTIPVRWCLSEEEIELLPRRKGADNNFVLLITKYENGKEDRRLIPCREVMTFVTFNWPGKNSLHAQIVGAGNVQEMKEYFLRKNNRYQYANYIFFKEDGGLGDIPYSIYSIRSVRYEIIVSAEFFAKKPPAWLERWVNFGYEYPAVDQCQLRRRMILAFSLKPIFIVLCLFVRFLCALGWIALLILLGVREIDFSVSIHPWRTALRDIHKNCSAYIQDRTRINLWWIWDCNQKRRSRAWILLAPFIFMSITVALETVRRYFGVTVDQYPTFLVKTSWEILSLKMVIDAFILLGVIFVSSLAVFMGREIYEKNKPKLKTLKTIKQKEKQRKAKQKMLSMEAREQRQKQLMEKEFLAAYNPISCSVAPEKASLETLPPQLKTIHLRFLDIKARLCKPFAG
ncbi:MAG: hypothetical protein NTY33_01795 [Candidatus Moranbacteria bacterium]|nr:hypothetical protein [Candidatus Moranbacteria bacterium]